MRNEEIKCFIGIIYSKASTEAGEGETKQWKTHQLLVNQQNCYLAYTTKGIWPHQNQISFLKYQCL